jgi:hypothetical protein
MTGNGATGCPGSFSFFPALPAELRLQIWESALETMQEPRVVNIFVKCHNPTRLFSLPSRLTVLNNEYLRRTDVVSSLLGVNSEARSAALAYLAAHPADEAREALIWRSKKAQRWKGLYKLCVDLLHLRIDPKRDALFLNGLDLEPILQDGVPTGQFRIPDFPDAIDRVLPLSLLPPWYMTDQPPVANRANRNVRELEGPERTFTSRFRTVIMPVHGLIDPWGGKEAEALFDDPMLAPYDRLGYFPALLNREMGLKTFIAVVGHYRGRNLQLADLEFMDAGGDFRRARYGSIHQRDVLVMTAVWEEWILYARIRHDCEVRRYTQLDLGPFQRPTLRFARVNEEVLARLSGGDQYFGNDESIQS